MSLDALVDAIGEIRSDARRSPLRQFEVTQVEPLLVRDLTTPNATPLTPLTTYTPTSVGERVYALRLGNRVLVIGKCGGATGGQGADGAPAGAVLPYAGASAPTGYLMCDGGLVLRASYPALFAVIGTTYGSTLSTNFRVPNLLGRVPVGRDSAQTEFDALGETGGAKTHTLTVDQMPAHSHPGKSGYDFNMQTMNSTAGTGGNLYAGGQRASTTGDAGGGEAHPILQPYITLNYIIKT